MKKLILASLLSVFLSAPASADILSLENSLAMEQYKKRPVSEFSKLLYLKDILKESDFTIIYNGRTYEPSSISTLISTYVRLNYKKESAETWIAKHAYRSPTKGKIIYLKDPQGETVPLKDVLLSELKTLQD